MAEVRRHLPHPPETVFTALTTPETYPFWLVGCQAIRAVDPGWPAVGTAFHHRVGVIGAVTVADSTKVLEVEAPPAGGHGTGVGGPVRPAAGQDLAAR